MPRQIDDLVNMLKVSRGADRFLLEVHPKLRPVEMAVRGIVLAGTAQGPMNIQESLSAASAAAAKVASLLGAGQVELPPFVARVDREQVQWHGCLCGSLPGRGRDCSADFPGERRDSKTGGGHSGQLHWLWRVRGRLPEPGY